MRLPSAGILLALALAAAAAAPIARADTYGDRLIAQGNELFKSGNYFRASESYRTAVLEEPSDGAKKLVFGTSLLALGHYAYASFSFRRGIEYLGYADDLQVDVASLFPSRSHFDRALRDVRRYVQFYPNDPQALTALVYAAYFAGDRPVTADACRRLLQSDAHDAFAAYFLRRVERDGAPAVAVQRPQPIVVTPPPPPPPPAAKPAPPPAPVKPPAPDPRAEALQALGADGARMGPLDTLSKDADAPRPAVSK